MQLLCASSQIPNEQSIGFNLDKQAIFAVRKQGKLYIYRNQCPHLGINLEWLENQFLDADGCLIQCAMHGALFLIEDGQCISGPCQGQKLIALEHQELDGQIFVAL